MSLRFQRKDNRCGDDVDGLRDGRIAILGAGPAGLAAAYRLVQRGAENVTVLEQLDQVGGTAGSFELAGLRVDYGSHRLHPVCDPEVLSDIRTLLGDDLLDRPRHGRIWLRGRWIHFPLRLADLAVRLPPDFAIGVAADTAGRFVPRRTGVVRRKSFASVLEQGLGRTICRDFYFPYARKLWGLAPEDLDMAQASRRVSALSVRRLVGKVLSSLTGFGRPNGGRFMYPRQGFGQIAEAFAQAAVNGSAKIRLNATVRSVQVSDGGAHSVCYEENGAVQFLEADQLWSTIPVTALTHLVKPAPPAECLKAAGDLEYRAMILVYMVLEQKRFSEYDAHYFPGVDIPITRLSEPKNYSGGAAPPDRTVLCAELPCDPRAAEWSMSDDALGLIVRDALAMAGIPVRARVARVVTRRLGEAYPIYRRGYEHRLGVLERHFDTIDRFVTFGRQGLFVHDNAHHAMHMGYCAVACLDDHGRFDRQRWQAFRRVFATHVVED